MSVGKGFHMSDGSTGMLDWNYVTNPEGDKSIIEEVNDVKADLSSKFVQTNNFIAEEFGVKNYLFTDDGYITTSGTTADVTAVVSNTVMSWCVIPCQSGDKFKVTGTGATQGRLWAFVADNGTVLDKETTTSHYNKLELTAPTNSAYLVVNARMDSDREVTSGSPSINNRLFEEYDIDASVFKITANIISTTGWTGSVTARTALIPVEYGEKYVFVNNKSSTTVLGVLRDTAYSGGITPHFSESYPERITVAKNQKTEIVVPYDAAYIAVLIVNNNGVDVKPQIIKSKLIKQNIVCENQMWSWWIYPMMVSFVNHRDKLYWTWTDSFKDAGISSYDFKSHKTESTVLKSSSESDDHNGVAVLVIPSGTNIGRIVCAYATGHQEDMVMHVRRSTVIEDITRFENAVDLTCSDYVSYAQLFYYNSTLYLFYRVGGASWAYRTSSDDGDTWSNETVLISATMQYYCLFRETTTSGVLRVLMTSNPGESDPNIRMGFLHLDSMTLYNSNNTTVVSGIATNFDILIATTSGYDTQRLFDCAITAINAPKVLYAIFNTTSNNDSVYKLYNNGTTVTICNGGSALWRPKYQLGACFYDDSTIISARMYEGSDIVEIYDATGTLKKFVVSNALGSYINRTFRPMADVHKKAFGYLTGFYDYTSYRKWNADAVIIPTV